MAEIRSIHGGAALDTGPCTQTIECLEKLLERAKAGQIKGISFATVTNIGGVGSGWGGSARLIDMAAGVSALHHRVMMALVETGS